jgi:hypothetical protein
MRGFVAYVGLCVVEAWEDTKLVLGRGRREHWVWGLIGAVITGLALGVLSFTRGNPAMFTQLDWYVAKGWVFVFLVPAIFLVALLLAPFQLHQRQVDKIDTLTADVKRLEARLQPRLEIVFDPTCQGCRSPLSNAHLVFRICVGVANTGDAPSEGITVYVQTLSVAGLKVPAPLRRLEYSGWNEGVVTQPPVDPVTLNPSADSDHHHFALMVHRQGNMFVELLLAGEPAPVSVEARDLTGEIVVSNTRAPVKRGFGLDSDQFGKPLLRIE